MFLKDAVHSVQPIMDMSIAVQDKGRIDFWTDLLEVTGDGPGDNSNLVKLRIIQMKLYR